MPPRVEPDHAVVRLQGRRQRIPGRKICREWMMQDDRRCVGAARHFIVHFDAVDRRTHCASSCLLADCEWEIKEVYHSGRWKEGPALRSSSGALLITAQVRAYATSDASHLRQGCWWRELGSRPFAGRPRS